MRAKNPEYFTLLEEFIDEYIETYDRSPSQREVSKGTGMSTAAVSRYLSYMKETGMLNYDGTRHIITHKQRKKNHDTVEVPVVGSIACGIPMFAEQNIEEYVRLPVSWFGNGSYYLLRTFGESMIDIGIEEGDLVIVRMQNYADSGQIIVALVENNDTTLKRYYPDQKTGMIRLHPENSEMEDIIVAPDELQIQGVAVKVLKDIV
ncbi:MAG: repressor LexA [Ruminococcus sp.]|nr:repressor LexA [Ruminococcus sp.]